MVRKEYRSKKSECRISLDCTTLLIRCHSKTSPGYLAHRTSAADDRAYPICEADSRHCDGARAGMASETDPRWAGCESDSSLGLLFLTLAEQVHPGFRITSQWSPSAWLTFCPG